MMKKIIDEIFRAAVKCASNCDDEAWADFDKYGFIESTEHMKKIIDKMQEAIIGITSEHNAKCCINLADLDSLHRQALFDCLKNKPTVIK